MAEETYGGAKSAGGNMVKTVAYSGIGGLLMILALLFSIGNDPDTILAGPTLQPIVNIFSFVFTRGGTISDGAPIYGVLMTILFVFNNFLNGFTHTTITTRIGYAMARDEGLPFSKWLMQLNRNTKNPDNIIYVLLVIEAAFCALPIFSS